MIEILTETAGGGAGGQVLTTRGENPDVHGLAAGTAEAPHGLLLDDLEELGLQGRGQETDLVEEKNPAVRGLEKTRFGVVRPGEGAPLEAEQLGLEQGCGDRGAIDIDEGALAAWAFAMDQSREESLAGTGFTLQEHRRRTPARLSIMAEKLAELRADGNGRRTLADQFRQQRRHGRDRTPVSPG